MVEGTRRERIAEELRKHWMSLRALSLCFECPEKIIAEDIAHIKKSVFPQERLVKKPAECLNCGFVFKEREKIKQPSRCPKCNSERIMASVFMIVENK